MGFFDVLVEPGVTIVLQRLHTKASACSLAMWASSVCSCSKGFARSRTRPASSHSFSNQASSVRRVSLAIPASSARRPSLKLL